MANRPNKERKEPEAVATQEALAGELGLEQEPETSPIPPLQESVPFEEERRSYDRRRGRISNWKGPERRSGVDRRAVKAKAKEKEFAPAAKPRASDIQAAQTNFEKFRVVIWATVLLLVPTLTFLISGWERALAASCVAAAFYFVSFFFRINKN